jgi:hypothetical protein
MKRIGGTRGVPSPLFFVRVGAKGLNLPEMEGGASVDSNSVGDSGTGRESGVDFTGVKKRALGGV